MVIYNLGDGETRLPISDVTVSNGQYHQVTLERYGKQMILKLDGGEGRYYTETLGPTIGLKDFNTRQDQMYSGASVTYASGSAGYSNNDLKDCKSSIEHPYN